ncbi:MAG: hypothetical protein WC897_03225 [Candidatus Gracilibacteria bacterium]
MERIAGMREEETFPTLPFAVPGADGDFVFSKDEETGLYLARKGDSEEVVHLGADITRAMEAIRTAYHRLGMGRTDKATWNNMRSEATLVDGKEQWRAVLREEGSTGGLISRFSRTQLGIDSDRYLSVNCEGGDPEQPNRRLFEFAIVNGDAVKVIGVARKLYMGQPDLAEAVNEDLLVDLKERYGAIGRRLVDQGMPKISENIIRDMAEFWARLTSSSQAS